LRTVTIKIAQLSSNHPANVTDRANNKHDFCLCQDQSLIPTTLDFNLTVNNTDKKNAVITYRIC